MNEQNKNDILVALANGLNVEVFDCDYQDWKIVDNSISRLSENGIYRIVSQEQYEVFK